MTAAIQDSRRESGILSQHIVGQIILRCVSNSEHQHIAAIDAEYGPVVSSAQSNDLLA